MVEHKTVQEIAALLKSDTPPHIIDVRERWEWDIAHIAGSELIPLSTLPARVEALDPSRPYFMQFKMKADEETFFEVLAAEAEKDFDPIELVYPGEVPYFDRYDEFVPEELVRKGFAEGVLDIEGMKQRVHGWRDHA